MRKPATLLAVYFFIFSQTSPVLAQGVDETIKKGEELSKKWDYKGAVTLYEKALITDTNNYELLWRIADNYIKLGIMAKDTDKAALYEKAADCAAKAIAVDPEKINGHTRLAIAQGRLAIFKGGKIKVELSKSVKAEAEKALKINPNNDEALHTLGAWHREIASLPGILKVFAKIIYGGLPPASKEEAVKYLEKAVVVNPKIVEHHLELGRCYMKVNNWVSAKKAWGECLALTPIEAYDRDFQAEAKALLQEYKKR